MPNYTLGEMMSYATSRIGRRADIPASDVSRMVNKAIYETWYAAPQEEAEKIAVSSLTTGENKIEVPSDFHTPISLTLITSPVTSSGHSSYNTLELLRIEEIDAMNPQPSGTPVAFAYYNSWLELYPSPNSAFSFQLRYESHPSDLTSEADVPSLSTPWRRAAELKAAELVAEYVNDEALKQSCSVDYLRYVGSLDDKHAKRQRGQFRFNVTPQGRVGGRRKVTRGR